jgi:hypothetical protein
MARSFSTAAAAVACRFLRWLGQFQVEAISQQFGDHEL